jgi:hypothetical protein
MQNLNYEFLDELQAVCVKHSLRISTPTEDDGVILDYDPAYILSVLLPEISASHTMEQGEAPSGFYPRLLEAYSSITQGDFNPLHVKVDSDDEWESLILQFECMGVARSIKVSGVDDSDYFTPDFVVALNGFADTVGLSGRWIDFYDGDDGCTSVYVPLGAVGDFRELKSKFSKD